MLHRMNTTKEKYVAMGANSMSMEVAEKPKGRLFSAVLPSVWLIKLRSLRRRSQSLKSTDSSEPVIPDSAPFLPKKTVENCYKHGPLASEICTFSPLQGPQGVDSDDPARPGSENHAGSEVAVSSTPSKKGMVVRPEGTTRSVAVTSVSNTPSSTTSMFSRCLYKSTFFSGIRNLCKLVGDESISRKESNPSIQFRKTATPTMRAWFLVGCGGTPRRRSRHSSLDMEKESGLIELDTDSGLDCIEEGTGGEDSWPKKSESWSGANPTPWSCELNNEELVKNQVVVKKKKKFSKSRELKGVKVKSPAELKPGSKPTLGHLFSTRSDTDSPRKIYPETEEESEIHIEDPKLDTVPWRSTSFGSDSTLNAPWAGSEYGLGPSERKPATFFSESELPAACKEEADDGNTSDSQSLLRQKVLAAERLREGSKSWREQQRIDMKRKDADAVNLLASLDQALEQRNLKRLIEDEEDSDPGYNSIFGSPRCELHSSPVFESFLESSAKAWGVEFPSHKIDDTKSTRSGSISDKSRELHCITVQTAPEVMKLRETAQERNNRGREISRAVRVNPSSAAKARKPKRPGDKDVSKRPSPSRKPISKDTREERTIHPQREESMVDPELHEDFNQARRKFNEARKRTKQRRSKQVASLPSPPASASAPAPKPPASVAKERVAVVVESSYDPYNDFRQSMIEMIVDQDIKETGDLEELLQCYLSLNEAEYHNIIVDVFTDVWHELFENKS